MTTAQVRKVSPALSATVIFWQDYTLPNTHVPLTLVDMTLGFPPFSLFHFSQRFAFDANERLC